MRHEFKNNRHVMVFDSVLEMTELAIESARNDTRFDFSHLPTESNARFAGRTFNGWENLETVAVGPWPEGLAIVEGMLAELEDSHLPPPTSIRRRACYRDDDGDEIDRDRLYSGKPFWRTTTRSVCIGSGTKTIVADTSTPGHINHASVLWRGAAAICLAKLLEQAGYRVELWSALHSTRAYTDGSNYFAGVCTKRPGDPLDIATLAASVSGWFLRTVSFASWSLSGKTTSSGYGTPTALGSLVGELTPDEDAIVAKDIWDRNAALAWVRNALEKINHPNHEGAAA